MSSAGGNADGVNRTLGILALVCERGPLTLTEVSDETGLARATTLRFLRGIATAGYVEQLPDRRWRATAKMWRLGVTVAARNDDLGRQLDDVLAQVAARTGESAVYSLYENGSIFYLAYSPSAEQVRTHVALGEQHHSSEVNSGRAVLAFRPNEEIDGVMVQHWGAERWQSPDGDALRASLEQIRSVGYAFSPNTSKPETWREIWGVAVPVFSGNDEAVGALAVTGPTYRTPEDPAAVAASIIEARASLILS